MPISKKKKDESNDDFMSRCMGDDVMNTEYPDQKQRAAVCNSQLETNKKDMTLDTFNARGVEIFSTGEWKGIKWTNEDLDEMISNFDKGVVEAYLNIDHNFSAGKQFKDALKATTLGWVDKLYRKGNKLIADFKQIPKQIAELIEAGALKKTSVEVYKQLIANGKLFKNVLEAVTFTGQVPEVNNLSDFIELYKKEDRELSKENELFSLTQDDFKKEAKVSEITIKQSEYDELIKHKNENADKNTSLFEDYKNQIESYKNDVIAKDKSIKDLETFKTDFETKEKENIENEANAYVTEVIKEGKILPKFKDKYVHEYVTYKNESDEALVLFKEDIDSRGEVVNLGEMKDVDTDDVDIENFKGESTEETDVAVKILMKKENLSFNDACKKLGLI